MLSLTNTFITAVSFFSSPTGAPPAAAVTTTEATTTEATTTETTTTEVTPAPVPKKPVWRRVGGFVGLEWRALGLGGHLSHGPGFQAGAIVFDHLAIGVAGFMRPGPINPRTFTFDLPEGQTYRGQSQLELRSDGSVLGLMVAPFHDLRRVPLSLELPVLVGYGGFGFYLHGDDREVPDDRRVSEWENDLLGDRDSDPVNLVVDVGLRLAWTPRRAEHLRPYLGVHYTWVTGFDTTIASRYDGASGVIGIKFGSFPARR